MPEPELSRLTRERAYYLWEVRGRATGEPDQDWFEAERQIAAEREVETLDALTESALKESQSSEEVDSTSEPVDALAQPV